MSPSAAPNGDGALAPRPLIWPVPPPYPERASAEKLGLPPLKPEAPWHGYSLGQWPGEFRVEAERAARSEYWTTGEVIKQRRRNDKRLNDPYLSL
jgi:hypothetical protein